MKMREKLARRIAFLAALLVVGLAWGFSYRQNPVQRLQADIGSEGRAVTPTRIAGTQPTPKPGSEQVFEQAGCTRCHSVAGRGSLRAPLDGIGSRLNEAQIRAWITPGLAAPNSYQARHADLGLSQAERDLLTAWMLGLRN
jgi:hypothetical protein